MSEQRSYIDLNGSNYHSNIDLTQQKPAGGQAIRMGFNNCSSGKKISSHVKTSSQPMTPLTRHITDQKMNGLEVIMSATREDNCDLQQRRMIDWRDLADRSVGCQTKES